MSFTSPRLDLRLVVTAKAVSLFGDEVALVALLLRLQSQGSGPIAVAALLTAGLLPFVVFAPLVGRIVDGHDSRMLLIASSLLQCALCAVLAVQTAPAAILALVFALGVGQALNSATWQALLPAIVGTDELPRAVGLSQAAGTVASLLAPVVAGVLTGRYGASVPLLVDAATFLLVCLAAIEVSTRRGGLASARADGERGGLRLMRDDTLLRTLLILLTVFVAMGSMVNVVEVFLVRDTLHASATWYGINGGFFALGMLGGALAAGRLRGRLRLARAFVGGAVVLALSLVAIGCAPSLAWLIPFVVVVGTANGVLNVVLGALVMSRVADEVRGRVAATVGGVASGAQIGAYVAGGVLGAAFSPREIFVLAGVLGLLAPLAVGRRLIREATDDPDGPPDLVNQDPDATDQFAVELSQVPNASKL